MKEAFVASHCQCWSPFLTPHTFTLCLLSPVFLQRVSAADSMTHWCFCRDLYTWGEILSFSQMPLPLKLVLTCWSEICIVKEQWVKDLKTLSSELVSCINYVAQNATSSLFEMSTCTQMTFKSLLIIFLGILVAGTVLFLCKMYFLQMLSSTYFPLQGSLSFRGEKKMLKFKWFGFPP